MSEQPTDDSTLPDDFEEDLVAADPVPEEERGLFGLSEDRVELIATIVLAAAVILTAWSAFQSGKWSGVQAVSFSEAGAARTESTRFSTQAGQLTQIDVALFVDWVAALSEEINDGLPVLSADGQYTPVEATLSRFLFVRMREEFKPAMDAWLATNPANNPDAPSAPFVMEEYVVAEAIEADRLRQVADDKATEAREANQTGDTYVLTAVMFATVLFFGGVSSKLVKRRNRYLALVMGVLMLVLASLIVFSLPIELGDEFFFLSD